MTSVDILLQEIKQPFRWCQEEGWSLATLYGWHMLEKSNWILFSCSQSKNRASITSKNESVFLVPNSECVNLFLTVLIYFWRKRKVRNQPGWGWLPSPANLNTKVWALPLSPSTRKETETLKVFRNGGPCKAFC